MISYRAAVASPGSGSVSGVIGEDILVLPDMEARHVDAVADHRTVGVVAEKGGPMLHLAIVSRAISRVVMVLPDAANLLRPGMRVVLDPKRCDILVVEGG